MHHSSSGPVAFTYSNNWYYYLRNAQGDIEGIVDSNGTRVVTYKYDAWGKLLGITGSDIALGELNPLRYRGYVYDTESELYYLQSRYYDPELCRFINADEMVKGGSMPVTSNLFIYCVNNPTNYYDNDGHDATWVQEESSAFGFGHSGCMIQDEETGEWWYFYWGPKDATFRLELFTGAEAECYFVKINSTTQDLSSVEGVRQALIDTGFSGDRVNRLSAVTYYEGDFSESFKEVEKMLNLSSTESYSLIYRSCVQMTVMGLSKSDERFSMMITPDGIRISNTTFLHNTHCFWMRMIQKNR